MPYLIAPDEPPGKAIRRVLREQNARILALFASWTVDPADAIHRARQACKRARAVAQLLKPARPYVANVENTFYRDIQRRVAYVRDTEALVEALDYLQIDAAEPNLAESAAMLRESLAARAARELELHCTRLQEQIDVSCKLLRDADRRLARLPVKDLHRRDLRRGADRIWGCCVVELAALAGDSPPHAYHSWRRRVKYAANQAQLLTNVEPERSTSAGPRLRELASLLGHVQDLEILEELLRRQPDALQVDNHVQRLRQLIATSLFQLRHRARVVGGELFQPAALVSGPGLKTPETEQQ